VLVFVPNINEISVKHCNTAVACFGPLRNCMQRRWSI